MRADGLLRRATQKSLAGSVFNILSFSPWPTRRKTFSLTVQSHTDVWLQPLPGSSREPCQGWHFLSCLKHTGCKMLVVSHLVAEIYCDSTQSEEHQDMLHCCKTWNVLSLNSYMLKYMHNIPCFQTAISEYGTMMARWTILSFESILQLVSKVTGLPVVSSYILSFSQLFPIPPLLSLPLPFSCPYQAFCSFPSCGTFSSLPTSALLSPAQMHIYKN